MKLLDNIDTDYTPQVGALCPKCLNSRRKAIGKLEKKSGKFGKFLSCTRYPDCTNSYKISNNLNKEASALLKESSNGKRRKTRRGKKKKRSENPERVRLFNLAMEEHREMKRQLSQHWNEANRLMETE
jgi:ssDNA-binding Zn-finger/Zn-ribbon topoisomerase 1